MPPLSIQHVAKRFPNGVVALHDLCLDLADGELLAIVGPSGSGKTTLLRGIAGLEKIDAGTIYLGERLLNDLPPRQRDVAMVFQQPALYPHLTVSANIAFPLRMRGAPSPGIDEQVRSMAALLKIDSLLNRRPHQLSGGQAQRVALARALIRSPKCLLLDEPFSHLDSKLKVELRTELRQLHDLRKITSIHVTHHLGDAAFADRIAIVEAGRVVTAVPTDEILRH